MKYARKLTFIDAAAVRDHYLRLDPTDRRLRFFGPASDYFIERHARRALSWNRHAVGCFVGHTLRAVGELALGGPPFGRDAEIALSVEQSYRRQGIGAELLDQLITMARNRAVRSIRVSCLRENYQVRRLVSKFEGHRIVAGGFIDVDIKPAWPDVWSYWREALADLQGMCAGMVS